MYSIKEVDELKITTLVENQAPFSSPLLAQHGLSFLLDIVSNDTKKRILFDVGPSSQTLLYNMKLLQIDPKSIDMIYLSHCHYDHTTGLVGILKEMDKETPIIAHPSLFRDTYSSKPFIHSIGISYENRKEEIVKYKGKLVLVNKPFSLMEGVLSTGEITRTTDFEKNYPNMYKIDDGELVPDIMLDDQSLIINIKDKGLVIISGCSHSGIVNIIHHAINITNISHIYGIIGGLHLASSNMETLEKTVDALTNTNIECLYAGHCTGFNALSNLSQSFGDKFEPLSVGKEIKIGKK
ncbi:MBL fold metallo-hydrolase [Inediibacterium massiliense]|uniref:MBL fold metallo-hydrolase n=1 Tax=Inediibacterium massiliense TaxID=1658111 RepID=UPI0006B4CEF4|nr:MBL fold metallo-hydrolase [Inediibacterium massiliense]